MKNWEKFEKTCYRYLCMKYGKDKIKQLGKNDATKPDIEVETNCGNKIFIEVKSASSQCCQFVLFPNEATNKFDFSISNRVPLSNHCKEIISYMDSSYMEYCNPNPAGKKIEINKSVLYGMVSDFHTAKNVKFFMTEGDPVIVFPLEKFHNYFDISATYRKKRSGSSVPNEKNNRKEIETGLDREQILGEISFTKIGKNRRGFLHTDKDIKKTRICCEKYTYLFVENEYSNQIEKQRMHVYEIKRLSNTSNPNVICQIDLVKNTQDKEDFDLFNRAISE